jgi:TatD DNase family protein
VTLYTDTHAHLSRLSDEVLAAIFSGHSNVGAILDIGGDADDMAARIKKIAPYYKGTGLEGQVSASRLPKLRFAAGIWPSHEAAVRRAELLPRLKAEIGAANPRDGSDGGGSFAAQVTAIGECGLDRHGEEGAKKDAAAERELFEGQIDLARALNLPVIVHSRDAPNETIAILKNAGWNKGIIHCYSYSPAEAEVFLALGFHISFAGNITYKKTERLREALKMVSDDRLLLETDSPFLSPQKFRGHDNNPAQIFETYALAAELRGTSPEALAALVARNASQLLGL